MIFECLTVRKEKDTNMNKMKVYTAVVKIGDGSKGVGLFRVELEVEASNEKKAREKALNLALSGTAVTVELSSGRTKGINPIYLATFGDNSEW